VTDEDHSEVEQE